MDNDHTLETTQSEPPSELAALERWLNKVRTEALAVLRLAEEHVHAIGVDVPEDLSSATCD